MNALKVKLENLKRVRERKRIYQREIAKAIGVDEKTYSNYETGRRNLSLIKAKQIADYLGMKLDDFF